MPDVKQLYETVTRQAPPRPDALERQRGLQRRRAVNRKLGTYAAVAAIIAAGVIAVGLASDGGGGQPGSSGPTVGPSVVPSPPDYVLDLDTGERTPLPDAIIGTLDLNGPQRAECVAEFRRRCSPEFSASRDGSLLAYVGVGDEGTPQIFVAERSTDGSPGFSSDEPRQVTHDPRGAIAPAWSPDGSTIAYTGYGTGDERNLFVLDLATGEATQVTHEGRDVWEPVQFTPDGTSLLLSFRGLLRIVSVSGGTDRLFIEPGRGLNDAFNGSLSPDGSLVTYLGSGSPLAPDGSPLTYQGQEITHAGPGRFLSRVDGTGLRALPGAGSNPSGTWSPDGTRIVCSGDDGVSGGGVIVIDVATGDIVHTVEGRSAIWLDDHTLLVEV